MSVFVETNGFRTQDVQYNNKVTFNLPVATNSAIELGEFAMAGLNSIFLEGINYKKVGVMLMELIPENEVQVSMFDNEEKREKQKKVMQLMDKINHSYGRGTIKIARMGTSDKRWKIRQEKLSPKYTTRWSDIMKIKI